MAGHPCRARAALPGPAPLRGRRCAAAGGCKVSLLKLLPAYRCQSRQVEELVAEAADADPGVDPGVKSAE